MAFVPLAAFLAIEHMKTPKATEATVHKLLKIARRASDLEAYLYHLPEKDAQLARLSDALGVALAAYRMRKVEESIRNK